MSLRFDEVYARHKDNVSMLVKNILRGTNTHPLHEDIVQEVFIRVHGLVLDGRFPTDVDHQSACVITIARGKAWDFTRANKRHTEGTEYCETEFDEMVWSADRTDFPCELKDLTERLRPKLRQVVELLAAGKTQTEIAALLEVSEATVNKRAERARLAMKEGANRILSAA